MTSPVNPDDAARKALPESNEASAARAIDVPQQIVGGWPSREWRDTHVVLAISGGADSVALLRAMLTLKTEYGGAGRLFVAHFNHGLRAAESDADAAWVSALCERFDVPIEVGAANVGQIAADQGDGWEAAARAARYGFLCASAERVGARFVVTAHTADDQVETVLHRIVRGTGLAGLTGIAQCRPLSPSVSLVRPMLATHRSEVVEYLRQLGQEYRIDSSNADSRFTRNRVRSELLPLLRTRFNSNVDGALLRLAAQAEETQRFLEQQAAEIAREYVVMESGVRVRIHCGRLASQSAVVIREVCKAAWQQVDWPLQAMGFAEWQLLAGLVAESASGRAINLPANIRAHREGDILILERIGLA
jgi:tRNA(Ile)-lysidine synthase